MTGASVVFAFVSALHTAIFVTWHGGWSASVAVFCALLSIIAMLGDRTARPDSPGEGDE